jgi:hypothetical protein
MKIWLLIFAEDEAYMGGSNAKLERQVFATENELLAYNTSSNRFNAEVLEIDTDQIKGGLAMYGCLSRDRDFWNRFEEEKKRRWEEVYPKPAVLKEALREKAAQRRAEAEERKVQRKLERMERKRIKAKP